MNEVTKFLENINHPLRNEIELLRKIIVNSVPGIEENIKWNGPNYTYNSEDRITMRIQPPKQIQLIFHRGAKKLAQPTERLINDTSELLEWKENDRAVVSFKNIDEINLHHTTLTRIINDWINVNK